MARGVEKAGDPQKDGQRDEEAGRLGEGRKGDTLHARAASK